MKLLVVYRRLQTGAARVQGCHTRGPTVSAEFMAPATFVAGSCITHTSASMDRVWTNLVVFDVRSSMLGVLLLSRGTARMHTVLVIK
jgi:hypothetical protein